MPHYHLEGLENKWTLVRETPSSQMFRVVTDDKERLTIDVHYTPPKVLTVNVCFIGHGEPSKSILTPVFDDLSKIALKRGDYAVIDYTLCSARDSFDGNFSVDEKLRKVMCGSLSTQP